jgi:signal transduction histidine kinase
VIRKSIYWKLALSFMLVACTTAGLVAMFIRLTSADRLRQLIVDQQRSNVVQGVSSYYSEQGSWQGVNAVWGRLQGGSNQGVQGQRDGGPGPRGQRSSLFGLADTQGVVVVPSDPQYPIGAQLPADILHEGTPILVDGRQAGTLITARVLPAYDPAESQYLQRTNQALVLAAMAALCVALVLGVFLARTIARPLQALTQAAQDMGEGKLSQEVRVTSADEVGQLAVAFNRMSQEVARVNRLRRQMTADVAHDLRTPLTVIAGYVESMRDGVLHPTPERLALIYGEIERLQDLVGDLRTLTQADAGELPLNLETIEPAALLDRAAALFCHRAESAGVALGVETPVPLPEVLVDEARMMQVFGNLLDNALRYTPAGGAITLCGERASGGVSLTVRDTGTGIPNADLPYVFDRFYRVDKARASETGESGLGLAIVKALVESQHGTVRAESKPGQGTAIHIELPAAG